MEVRDINPGPDVAGIRVGQNTIVLPTSDLQDALNHSSGTIGNYQTTCMSADSTYLHD